MNRRLIAALIISVFGACSQKSEIPMSPLEQQNARGLAQRVVVLRSEIARVASGNQNLESAFIDVARAVQALDHDDEELRTEAGKRLGVAVVQSGTSWVAK